jgi:hypothetical protein
MIGASLRENHPDGLWRADSISTRHGWTVQVIHLTDAGRLVAEFLVSPAMQRLSIDVILERAIEYTRGWWNAERN